MPKIITKIELSFYDLVRLIAEKYNLKNTTVSVIIEQWEKDILDINSKELCEYSLKDFKIKAEGEIKSDN